MVVIVELVADPTQYLVASFALYVSTMVLLKISLGIFFLRIVVKKWQRWTIYCTVAVSTIYGGYYFFGSIFQCGDPTKFLEHQLAGKCVSNDALLAVNITAGVINAVTDWILALLPIFVLRKANMPRPAKISAGCILLLGSLGSVVSCVRLVYVKSLQSNDQFFDNAALIMIWSIIEPGVGITCAALATLRPFFRCCMENARNMTPSIRSRGHKGVTENSTWRSDGAQHPGSRLSFEDRGPYRGPQDVELQEGNLTTVIGNARAMEKKGITHETIRKASVKKTDISRPILQARESSQYIPQRTPSQRPLIDQGPKLQPWQQVWQQDRSVGGQRRSESRTRFERRVYSDDDRRVYSDDESTLYSDGERRLHSDDGRRLYTNDERRLYSDNRQRIR